MFHQKLDVGCLELSGLVPKDLRVREYIGVEWSFNVHGFFLVELEGTDAKLERVHARAAMLKLLIALFNVIESVSLVFISDSESRELRIDSNEVRSPDGFDN